jgi:hypothetical protein
MTEPKKKKRKKSQYCEYAHNCDKDILTVKMERFVRHFNTQNLLHL